MGLGSRVGLAGGQDWAVAAAPRGEKVGNLSTRNMRLGSLFCDVSSSPRDTQKAILIYEIRTV